MGICHFIKEKKGKNGLFYKKKRTFAVSFGTPEMRTAGLLFFRDIPGISCGGIDVVAKSIIKMKDKKQDINRVITQDKILFFDMDGTLVDTDYANYLSFKMAIQAVINPNKLIPFNPYERFNRTILQREFPNIHDDDFQKIIKLKEKFYSENIEHTKLMPFANEVLNKFFEVNTTVLVTNCREDRALMTLSQHNLVNKFKHKIFRKSMDKAQHINKFENALKTLDLEPQMIIAFENEQFEIDEAVRAGIPINNIINIKI